MSFFSTEDIWRALAENVTIVLIHTEKAALLNMDDYYVNTFFIPTDSIEKYKIAIIDDIDLKVEMYKDCIHNLNGALQGTKKYNFPLDNEE